MNRISYVILLLAVLLFENSVFALECPSLRFNETISLDITKAENYTNCFSLADAPQNSQVQISVITSDEVRNKVTLSEIDNQNVLIKLGDWFSELDGTNLLSTNTTTKHLSFTLTPQSHTTTDKRLSISLMNIDSTVHIVVAIEEIPSEPAPPINDGCEIINDIRICNEIQ